MIPLERVDDSTAQRNFDTIAARVPDTGGRSVAIRFGRATIAWGGVNDYAEATVDHGLGAAPAQEFCTANDQDGTGHVMAMTTGSNASTVTIRVATLDGSVPPNTETTDVSWMVIG